MPRARSISLLVVALVLVAGCGDSGGGGEARRNFAQTDLTVPEGVEPAPLTATILADGRVTDDEMRTALDAAADCLRDAGFDAEVSTFEPGTGGNVTTPEQSTEATQAEVVCTAEFVSPVRPTYVEQNGPTEEETRKANELVAACLRDKGHEVPEGATMTDMLMQVGPSEFGACNGGQP